MYLNPRAVPLDKAHPDAASATSRASTIVRALGGSWSGDRGMCHCPAHADRSPSLSVRLGRTAILYHCFAGCSSRDVLAALRRLDMHNGEPVRMPRARLQDGHAAIARRLWNDSVPIASTLAEQYLLARGLSPPFPRSLRFNPATILGSKACRRVMPAMIAAIENDAGVVAVQRTFLDAHDPLRKPIARPKVALGLIGGAAIRLVPASHELGLAEGVEDARSATEWFGTPTWALGGVERLAFVTIPEKVRRVILYGDRGPATERALAKARSHLTAHGRELVVRLPTHHDDWNDAWRAFQRDRANAVVGSEVRLATPEERAPAVG